jgi:hypothetical protein
MFRSAILQGVRYYLALAHSREQAGNVVDLFRLHTLEPDTGEVRNPFYQQLFLKIGNHYFFLWTLQ